MLSLVIPVHNEAPSLDPLYRELVAVTDAHALAAELIFVDDGSTDDSWAAIRRLAETDARVRGARFRRNFGKTAALAAGFRLSRGSLIITMDADLQDDPAEIPRLLEQIGAGVDLVSGWKRERLDPPMRVVASRVFNALVRGVTGVALHDHNCGFKAYRRAVIDEVRLSGDLHRLIPVLASARGFRVGEVPVRHRARRFGRSKYGPGRFLRGLLDLALVKLQTTFGTRPHHALGNVGATVAGAGLALAGGLAAIRLATGAPDPSLPAWLLYAIVAVLAGLAFLALGLTTELVLGTTRRSADLYSIAETLPADARPAADAVEEASLGQHR